MPGGTCGADVVDVARRSGRVIGGRVGIGIGADVVRGCIGVTRHYVIGALRDTTDRASTRR